MKLLRECGFLLMVAAVCSLLSLWLHPKRPVLAWAAPAAQEVELKEALQWQRTILWVDARGASAFETRHIPTAVWLNEAKWNEQLPEFLAAWRPGMKIVVYCESQTCDLSQAVAQRLERELSLSEIYVLKGGWSAWQQYAH